jgi:hypothetical protein
MRKQHSILVFRSWNRTSGSSSVYHTAWLLVIAVDIPFLDNLEFVFSWLQFCMSGNKAIAISSCNSKFHFILILLFLLAVCLHSLFLLITIFVSFQLELSLKRKTGHPFSLSFTTIFQMRYPSIYKKCSTLHFHHFWVSSANVKNVYEYAVLPFLFFCDYLYQPPLPHDWVSASVSTIKYLSGRAAFDR